MQESLPNNCLVRVYTPALPETPGAQAFILSLQKIGLI